MKKIAYLFLLILTGCTADEPTVEPMPVIEGWIDSDGHPNVLFTTAITPGSDGGELADALVRWGRVTISDGETEAVMTGIRDNNYFPPYRYYTTDLIGQPGKTYHVSASFKGMNAQATSTMPEPTPIDSITFLPTESEHLKSAVLHFTAPQSVPAYYYLTIFPAKGAAVGLPCLMGWKECTVSGEAVAVAILNSKQTAVGEDFEAQLRVGGHYVVQLHRVEKPVFDFWRAYDDALMFGNNLLFGGASDLPSNVSGGFGIFGARGTSARAFSVR